MAGSVGVAEGLRRWSRRPSGWRLGGGETHRNGLFARVLGSGPPRVLLLHGLGGSNRYWAAEFDALGGAHGSAVIPDLLGFGQSSAKAESYGLDAHARAVEALLDDLGAREPVVVGAHSFGTLVALRLAGRRPDLVGPIVAFGPPWYASPATARKSLARMGPMARLFALDARWSYVACRWSCSHRRFSAILACLARVDLPAPVAADGVQHSWPAYRGALEALIAADAPSLLAAATQPVYVVTGAEDMIPDAGLLADEEAAGRIIHVDVWAGGHDLPLVHRARAVELLLGLLAAERRGATSG